MKRLSKVFVVFLLTFISTLFLTPTDTNAAVSPYIKESKFKGEYYAEDKSYQNAIFLTIKSIKKGKVIGYIDRSNVSRELGANFTTSKINKNKANFSFEDNWGNKGKGTIIFNKNGTLKVTIKTTKRADFSRAEFSHKNITFFKLKKNTIIYSKLNDGHYYTHYVGLGLEDADANCESVKIKNGSIIIMGSLSRYSSSGELSQITYYDYWILKLSENCKIYALDDTYNPKMSISEFNQIFNDTASNIDFEILIKNNTVIEIFVIV